MKKFCKDVGIDKKTLMAMMLGGKDLEASNIKNEFNSSRKDPTKDSASNSIVKD